MMSGVLFEPTPSYQDESMHVFSHATYIFSEKVILL